MRLGKFDRNQLRVILNSAGECGCIAPATARWSGVAVRKLTTHRRATS
jgi:hypothetical protein